MKGREHSHGNTIGIGSTGRGRTLVIMPTMVPTKTASRCQAWAETPAGAGISQIRRPARTEYPRGFSFAPFHSEAAAACTAGTPEDALALTTRLASERLETADDCRC